MCASCRSCSCCIRLLPQNYPQIRWYVMFRTCAMDVRCHGIWDVVHGDVDVDADVTVAVGVAVCPRHVRCVLCAMCMCMSLPSPVVQHFIRRFQAITHIRTLLAALHTLIDTLHAHACHDMAHDVYGQRGRDDRYERQGEFEVRRGEERVNALATTCHVMSCHVILCHVILCLVMSSYVLLCHVMSCDVISCDVTSCHVMSYHVMSRRVMSCHVMSCHVMS